MNVCVTISGVIGPSHTNSKKILETKSWKQILFNSLRYRKKTETTGLFIPNCVLFWSVSCFLGLCSFCLVSVLFVLLWFLSDIFWYLYFCSDLRVSLLHPTAASFFLIWAGEANKKHEWWRRQPTPCSTTLWCMMASDHRTSEKPVWSSQCGTMSDWAITS